MTSMHMLGEAYTLTFIGHINFYKVVYIIKSLTAKLTDKQTDILADSQTNKHTN